MYKLVHTHIKSKIAFKFLHNVKHVLNQERYIIIHVILKEKKTRLKIKYFCLFEKFSMFLDFFFLILKKKLKKSKTTKNKNKTCPQTIERIKSGTSQQHSPWRIFSHPYSTSLRLCRWKSMWSRVYMRDYTNLLRKTKILQIPFTSQQA